VLAIGTAETKILPSSGKLTNKAHLKQYRDNIIAMHERLGDLLNAEYDQVAILRDQKLNAIWSRFTQENQELSDKVKARLLSRYIATDFVESKPLQNAQIVTTITGKYQLEDGTKLSVFAEGTRLFVKFDGWYKYELLWLDETTFSFRGETNSFIQINKQNECTTLGLTIQFGQRKHQAPPLSC
jgi:hypothetical protein